MSEWQKIPFDECFELHRNNTCSRALMAETGAVQNIHYGDILVNYGSVVNMDRAVVPYLTDEGVKCSPKDYLRNGDIVIADTAEDEIAGKVIEVQGVGERKVVAGLHTVFCRPKDADMFAPGWLGYWMNSSGYHDQLISMMTGIKVLSLSRGNFQKTYVCVPKKDEQERIVATFADADALIANTEKRIAKRKLIKQGMMQQLLTGAVRLPGFTGEWKEKSLFELGDFVKGAGISRSESQTGDIPAVRYGELYTHHDNYVKRYVSRISKEVAKQSRLTKRGDILFTCSGETSEDIGKAVAVLDDGVYAGGDLLIFTLREECDPVFWGTLMNVPYVQIQKSNVSHGATVIHITEADLRGLIVRCPPTLAEQQASAAVLTDMDSEIAVLEKKVEKYRRLKSGMMSELLTGKVQLSEGK